MGRPRKENRQTNIRRPRKKNKQTSMGRREYKNMKTKKQLLLPHLPSEIITEILLRLPAEAIPRCKHVCKSWQDLLNTAEFAKSHLSKSLLELVLTEEVRVKSIIYPTKKLLHMQHDDDDFHLGAITKLNFPSYHAWITGSADGLLLLLMANRMNKDDLPLWLCNPITREYIDLHHDQPLLFGVDIFGFGLSKITRQYKAIYIFQDMMNVSEPECKVYTIGTGSWRSIAPHGGFRFNLTFGGVVSYRGAVSHQGAFVNGNLHWLARDLRGTLWVSCFDLETELFSTLSLPPLIHNGNTKVFHGMLVLMEGSLCFCDYSSDSDMFIIWLMKEYGNEKSWTKKFVIKKLPLLVYPIQNNNDGVILTANNSKSLFYYSTKNKTTQEIYSSKESIYLSSYPHTPSLLSLKSFIMENSISF